jgi:hypothetical protein
MSQARPEYVTRNMLGGSGGEERARGGSASGHSEGEERPETLRPPAEGGMAGRT